MGRSGVDFSDRIEKWLACIPGLRTYKERENRRETDKKLREHLATRLQEVKSRLRWMALEWSQNGSLETLEELDRVNARSQQLADSIRYASYGYSGIFEVEKIREEELRRLYEFDLALMDDVAQLQSRVGDLSLQAPENRKKGISEINPLLDALEHKFGQRQEFMVKMPENPLAKNTDPKRR